MLPDFYRECIPYVIFTKLHLFHKVQPFAGIIDTVKYGVPRVLFNWNAVGPFRAGKRAQDVVAAGLYYRLCLDSYECGQGYIVAIFKFCLLFEKFKMLC